MGSEGSKESIFKTMLHLVTYVVLDVYVFEVFFCYRLLQCSSFYSYRAFPRQAPWRQTCQAPGDAHFKTE